MFPNRGYSIKISKVRLESSPQSWLSHKVWINEAKDVYSLTYYGLPFGHVFDQTSSITIKPFFPGPISYETMAAPCELATWLPNFVGLVTIYKSEAVHLLEPIPILNRTY